LALAAVSVGIAQRRQLPHAEAAQLVQARSAAAASALPAADAGIAAHAARRAQNGVDGTMTDATHNVFLTTHLALRLPHDCMVTQVRHPGAILAIHQLR